MFPLRAKPCWPKRIPPNAHPCANVSASEESWHRLIRTPIIIPTNGIWIEVSYPGNFTGYIGAQGRRIEINSSGTRLYQLPVDNAMIEGTIEKQDGSDDKLEVGIYNGGALVSKIETRKPWGLIEIHMPVGPANGGIVVSAPPLEIQVSPYASLPRAYIPLPGSEFGYSTPEFCWNPRCKRADERGKPYGQPVLPVPHCERADRRVR